MKIKAFAQKKKKELKAAIDHLMGKSSFDQEEIKNGFINWLIISVSIFLFLVGYASIQILCPGPWAGMKLFLLLFLIASGGNIGILYFILAYVFKMKVCK